MRLPPLLQQAAAGGPDEAAAGQAPAGAAEEVAAAAAEAAQLPPHSPASPVRPASRSSSGSSQLELPLEADEYAPADQPGSPASVRQAGRSTPSVPGSPAESLGSHSPAASSRDEAEDREGEEEEQAAQGRAAQHAQHAQQEWERPDSPPPLDDALLSPRSPAAAAQSPYAFGPVLPYDDEAATPGKADEDQSEEVGGSYCMGCLEGRPSAQRFCWVCSALMRAAEVATWSQQCRASQPAVLSCAMADRCA